MIDNPFPWGYLQLWWVPAYALVCVACLRIRPRALIPFFLLGLASAVHVIFRVVEFKGHTSSFLVGLQSVQAAAQSLLMLLAAAALFSYPWPRWFKRWVEWGLTGLCIYAGIVLFWYDGALFSNQAMASVCAVALLPLAAARLRVFIVPLLGLTGWSVYRCNEKVGLILFGILTVLALWNLRLRKISGLAGLALVLAALWHLPTLRYHWDDRAKTWALMINHVWAQAPVFGFGPGATWSTVRYLQQQAFGTVEEVFLMAHNDYLQVFYEMGLIGFQLALLAWVTILKHSWRKPEIRASLLCWSAAAVVHFPLHDPLTALAVLLTAKLALG